jgi:hypothetical protein
VLRVLVHTAGDRLFVGLVAWLHARAAIDPSRARWLTSGGVLLLAALGLVTAVLMYAVFTASLPQRGLSPTPVIAPPLFPTAPP